MIYLLPVESVLMLLIVEETIVLVDDLPQCLEIAGRGVWSFLLINARGEGDQGN